MIGLISGLKMAAGLVVFLLIAKGISIGWEAHLDTVDAAVNSAKKSIILEQNEFRKEREEELRQKSRKDLEVLETSLKAQRRKVSDLERMLFVDHDLDKLLQKKPGLILNIVNKGTVEYYAELEEITQ